MGEMKKTETDLGMYELGYFELEALLAEIRKAFYQNPSSVYLEPFRILGNLYYVGDKRVCAHLIDTGEGLILFDAGFQHTIHLLIQSIWSLGFNPADVKYLILSHGHFDHFGACNEFRSLYGAKSFMSKADCEMLKNTPTAGLLDMNPNPYAQLPIIDYEFQDGEIISLGNTHIECVLSPGHSPGTTSFFFDITDSGKTYKVGYFGGSGFLTLYRDFLKKYGLPLELQEQFAKTLNNLKCRQVDISLGNHPAQNSTLKKRHLMIENPAVNPFIDPTEWCVYLNKLEIQYREFLKKGH